MKAFLTIMTAAVTFISAAAHDYSYSFDKTPVAEAIVRIGSEHPDINIAFIYKELDKYKTSAKILTDNPYDALRLTVGRNPISIIQKGNSYYIEAMQHGRLNFTGLTMGSDNEPVAAATVMLLSPQDSTVITYGISDAVGRFSIPCDRARVIAKLSCLGYKTTFKLLDSPSAGTIVMPRHALALDSLTVEHDYAHLYSDKSVYLPTAKQKNSAQTAEDLINRMAMPQLRIGDEIKTTTGQPVEIYIDYIPATSAEMSGMRIADVRRVEYYDYPSDPRFGGNAHVINFIMQKYEYGGYVKGIYYDNFITSRQLNGYAKVQYKKMTYDWAGGAFYMDDRRDYENTYETFRLPQDDGRIKEFTRTSIVDKDKKRRNACWVSLKALYRTDKTVMSNMISADFDHTPERITQGTVTYKPADFTTADYKSQQSDRVNSLVYNAYWHFKLSQHNSLTFNPSYAYTHTSQNSLYDETGSAAIINGASDDSHQAGGSIAFVHSFGKAGSLKIMCQGKFLKNKTRYIGTSTTSDKAMTCRLGPGTNYSYTDEKFYVNAGIGLSWDRSEYGTAKENSTAPWVRLALQYAFNPKNSVAADFSYEKSIPSSSYRSAAVVQSNPLMSYTGNPALVPYKSYQFSASYTLIPSNKFSFSTFAYSWIVGNRYVFDYEASPDGLLRTVKQPMGDYAQWQYGVQGTARLLDNNLQLSLSCYIDQTRNGEPYNRTKSKLTGSLSTYYYLDKFYFGASYDAPSGYADGCMVGTWMTPRDSYTFQVGWADSRWNLRFFTRNFLRYDTYQTKGVMNSAYYDTVRYLYSSSSAGFFQISATYTFGFGKKVKAENEAYQPTGASSGILK